MNNATELDIDLFEAFLTETDESASNLLAELLGIHEERTSDLNEWDGIERRIFQAA